MAKKRGPNLDEDLGNNDEPKCFNGGLNPGMKGNSWNSGSLLRTTHTHPRFHKLLWMDEIRFAPPFRKTVFWTIFLQIATSNSFSLFHSAGFRNHPQYPASFSAGGFQIPYRQAAYNQATSCRLSTYPPQDHSREAPRGTPLEDKSFLLRRLILRECRY